MTILDQIEDAAESLASVQPNHPRIADALAKAVETIIAQDSLIERLEKELREARADRDIAEARCRSLEDRATQMNEIIRRWGMHDDGRYVPHECRVHSDGPDTCDCGFDEARWEVDKARARARTRK